MPFLSLAQRRTGRALHSSAVVSDSAQTMLCSWLSAVLLVGLLLNAVLGWGWADPVAGLVIAAVAVKEGLRRLARAGVLRADRVRVTAAAALLGRPAADRLLGRHVGGRGLRRALGRGGGRPGGGAGGVRAAAEDAVGICSCGGPSEVFEQVYDDAWPTGDASRRGAGRWSR